MTTPKTKPLFGKSVNEFLGQPEVKNLIGLLSELATTKMQTNVELAKMRGELEKMRVEVEITKLKLEAPIMTIQAETAKIQAETAKIEAETAKIEAEGAANRRRSA